MSRGGRRGKGFGATKLGANSIEMPENINIDCHEILLFPVRTIFSLVSTSLTDNLQLHDTIPFKSANQEEIELYNASDSFLNRMRLSLYYSEPEKPKPGKWGNSKDAC